MENHSRGEGIGDAAPSTLLLRASVVLCALAGALALALTAEPAAAPQLLALAGAVALVALVYLARPRPVARLLQVLGAIGCGASLVAIGVVGTTPWLLVSFWASMAVLLAGLLHFLGAGGDPALASATVVAIATLLVLSAVGVGQYVRVEWALAEREVLSDLPRDALEMGSTRLGATPLVIARAPGGAWGGTWSVRTRDAAASWEAFSQGLRDDGWNVFADEAGRELRAEKDGYQLMVVAREPAPYSPGPAKYSSRGLVAVSMRALLEAR